MLSKKSLILIFFIGFSVFGKAQDKFYTKSGKIEFSSKASLEDIEAKNKTASAILDAKSGTLQFSVLMKSFEFEKALMEEHFNSDYVESDKYPKAEFKGTILNNSAISYNKDGIYQARIKGRIAIHGITRDLETLAVIKVAGSHLETNTAFSIVLTDFNIRIPSVVKDKVSRNIKISVNCKLDPLL